MWAMSITGHSISQWLPCPVPSWVANTIGTWGGNPFEKKTIQVYLSINSQDDNSSPTSASNRYFSNYVNQSHSTLLIRFTSARVKTGQSAWEVSGAIFSATRARPTRVGSMTAGAAAKTRVT